MDARKSHVLVHVQLIINQKLKEITNIVYNSAYLLQELWVYLAEEKHFTDFNSSEKLIWHETDIKFGNWTDGPQMDGSRLKSTTIQASEVMMCIEFLILVRTVIKLQLNQVI